LSDISESFTGDHQHSIQRSERSSKTTKIRILFDVPEAIAIVAKAEFHVLNQQGRLEDCIQVGFDVKDFDRLFASLNDKFNCNYFRDLQSGSESTNGEELGIELSTNRFRFRTRSACS